MKAVETVRTAFPLTSVVPTASPPSAVPPSATRAVAASHGTRAVASNQHEKAAEAAEAAESAEAAEEPKEPGLTLQEAGVSLLEIHAVSHTSNDALP